MESSPAECRSCLTESAHLVLGRPLGLFQPWMLGLKSMTLRTGRDDDMRWRCPNQRRRRCRRRDDAVGLVGAFTDALIADVLLPEHTREASLTAHVEHV